MKKFTFIGRDSGSISAYYVTWEGDFPNTAYPGTPPFGGPIVDISILRASTEGQAPGAYGLASAKPSPTGSGTIYFCTDLGIAYVDDPTTTTWIPVQFVSGGTGGTSPGLASGWTAVGNVDIQNRGDAVYLASTVNNKDHHAMKPIPGTVVPAGPWKVTMAALGSFQPGSNYPSFGICVSQGIVPASSPALFCGTYNFSGNAMSFGAWFGQINSQNRPWGSGFGTNSSLFNTAPIQYFRILNDATNFYFQYSLSGSLWVNAYQVAIATAPTVTAPTHYGITCGCINGTGLTAGLVNQLDMVPLTLPTITNMVYGAPNITVTTSTPHGFLTGDTVSITGVSATGSSPNAVYTWINRLSATTFTITALGSMGYLSGGKAMLVTR